MTNRPNDFIRMLRHLGVPGIDRIDYGPNSFARLRDSFIAGVIYLRQELEKFLQQLANRQLELKEAREMAAYYDEQANNFADPGLTTQVEKLDQVVNDLEKEISSLQNQVSGYNIALNEHVLAYNQTMTQAFAILSHDDAIHNTVFANAFTGISLRIPDGISHNEQVVNTLNAKLAPVNNNQSQLSLDLNQEFAKSPGSEQREKVFQASSAAARQQGLAPAHLDSTKVAGQQRETEVDMREIEQIIKVSALQRELMLRNILYRYYDGNFNQIKLGLSYLKASSGYQALLNEQITHSSDTIAPYQKQLSNQINLMSQLKSEINQAVKTINEKSRLSQDLGYLGKKLKSTLVNLEVRQAEQFYDYMKNHGDEPKGPKNSGPTK